MTWLLPFATLLRPFVAALALTAAAGAHAQDLPVKFQLDWRFEGPAAMFLVPEAKGYFKAEKLAVTIDAGNGSGGTVTRIASGAYDMGFADLAALMEFQANNPAAPNKPVAVMMVYNNTPAAAMALKKSGITKPADLNGKKMGAPIFDAGRKAWPIFAKANHINGVTWTAMDPTLRETMLVRGDIDAITGFSFTSLLNLEARGVKAADVVVAGLQFSGLGSLMNFQPTAAPLRSVADLAATDARLKDLLFFFLAERGLYLARRGFVALSLPIGTVEMDRFVAAFGEFVETHRALLPPRG